MNSFYNTTKETGQLLKQYESTADSQEQLIYKIFLRSPGLTASEVMNKYPNRNVPITSIRRALTNLKNNDILVKTETKRTGIYGRPEYVYRLRTGQLNLFYD